MNVGGGMEAGIYGRLWVVVALEIRGLESTDRAIIEISISAHNLNTKLSLTARIGSRPGVRQSNYLDIVCKTLGIVNLIKPSGAWPKCLIERGACSRNNWSNCRGFKPQCK